jgi:hypothetical protein
METTGVLKAEIPAAKTFYKVMKKLPVILLLAMPLVWYACSTNKPQTNYFTDKKSHYQIQKYNKSQPGDSAIVAVSAKRIGGETLKSFIIKVNEKNIYEFKGHIVHVIFLAPGSYTFQFLEEFSYRTTTREITLSEKDSVKIDFYSKLNPIDN